ncbi:MAG: restriction endonuclease subunit S [Ignavibacteriaceae bacterium]|nr:restriction endonuclease subunit S [Ignavibacteriaceae bacterium]
MREQNFPPSWSWVKLGNICETTSGGTPSRKIERYYKGNIPWIKSGELNFNTIKDSEEKINKEALDNSSAKLFPKGTLLIALYGATVGRLAFLGIDAATNQAIAAIYTPKNLSNKFLYWYLFSYREHLLKQRIGGAQPNISQGTLKNIPIPLPPLLEQIKIVNKIEELFSQLDSGIASLKNANDQIHLYRQSVLASAFSGKLVKNNKEAAEHLPYKHVVLKAAEPHFAYKAQDSHQLPNGWKELTVNDICEKIIGGGTPSTGVSKYWDGDTEWITSADIFGLKDIRPRKKITEEAIKNSATNKVPTGTIIVVTRVGLGKLAIAQNELCFSQDCQGLILKRELVTEKFALWFLSKGVEEFKYKNRGTTINGVAKKQLADLKFLLPPLNQQSRIVDEIEKRFSEADNLEKTIDKSLMKAESLKQSILKKAFEGKLLP